MFGCFQIPAGVHCPGNSWWHVSFQGSNPQWKPWPVLRTEWWRLLWLPFNRYARLSSKQRIWTSFHFDGSWGITNHVLMLRNEIPTDTTCTIKLVKIMKTTKYRLSWTKCDCLPLGNPSAVAQLWLYSGGQSISWGLYLSNILYTTSLTFNLTDPLLVLWIQGLFFQTSITTSVVLYPNQLILSWFST